MVVIEILGVALPCVEFYCNDVVRELIIGLIVDYSEPLPAAVAWERRIVCENECQALPSRSSQRAYVEHEGSVDRGKGRPVASAKLECFLVKDSPRLVCWVA